MKKQNLKTKNHTSKGITLIALVITIIIMLILAAVSITMAVNGGLFGYAQNASTETQKERDLELEMGNLEDNLTYDNMITKYAIVYGDVDLNGKVNGNDATRLSRYLQNVSAGVTPLPKNAQISEHGKLNADACHDGILDEKDVSLIRIYSAYSLGGEIKDLPWTVEQYEEWVANI